MAIDIDWIARLRTAPSGACPSEAELQAFVENPEGVTPASFSHILTGCVSCRRRLQDLVLHPSIEDLKEYLLNPRSVPEEMLMHCAGCRSCQRKVRRVLASD